MLQEDMFRDRKVEFSFKGEKHTATFTWESGWSIFDERGIVQSSKSNPEVWKKFREQLQPPDTKSELYPQ